MTHSTIFDPSTDAKKRNARGGYAALALDGHRFIELDTPAGPFRIGRQRGGAIVTAWPKLALDPNRMNSLTVDDEVCNIADRLNDYFSGERIDFNEVPLPDTTDFQSTCWRACRSIPYGTTVTYADLAVLMGCTPHAARAVGQAMRRNPQPVMTPCHRVVARAGRLHGYAGSTATASPAVNIKRTLLQLEVTSHGRSRN